MKTEARRKVRGKTIDNMTGGERFAALLNDQKKAVVAVENASKQIEEAAVAIAERLKISDTGKIVYAGAGTSGRLGVQDGAELWPTYGWPINRVKYLIAGDFEALRRSIEGAEDDTTSAAIADTLIGADDVVIAIAASGTTPYTLAWLRAAHTLGALTIGIANNPNTPILKEAQYPIFLDTGSELVAGSTRMKAATAQRIALNTLSTLVMVELGYVYDGLMVCVQPTNEKLRKRAVNMVVRIAKCEHAEARTALENAGWDVRKAVLMRKGHTSDSAQHFLQLAAGNLGDALSLHELDLVT